MSGLHCWQCGVEPTDVVEITALADPEPRYLPTGWPRGDHEHAVEPPTPGDLLAAGARAFDRAMEQWMKL